MTHTKRQIEHADETYEDRRYGSPKFAYREMSEPVLLIISFSVAVVLVALFAVSGPRSTAETLNLMERVGYFASVAALCWPMGHAFGTMLLYFARRCSWSQMAPATLVAGVVSAANTATVAYGLFRLFVPHYAGDVRWSIMFLLATVVIVPYAALINFLACQRAGFRPVVEGPVAAGRLSPATAGIDTAASIAGAAAGPEARQEAGGAQRRESDAPQSPPDTGQDTVHRVRFLDRLPAALGRDVVYLKVRSHYVHVVTTAGSKALLMRFADAVAELADLGMQVHRSYWVARRHVVGMERRAERTVLLLSSGEEVPVSRTYLAAVREALPASSAGAPE